MKRETIFYVDDNKSNLLLVKKYLKKFYDVVTLDNPRDLISQLLDRQPDFVLLDVNMPNIDGYELCRKIRSEPQLEDVPIAFLTARKGLEDRLKGFDSGGDAYITKPFELEELKYVIQSILKRYNDYVKVKDDVTSANDMVFMMMRNSSEIGEIVQYARSLSKIKDEGKLLKSSFQTLNKFGLNSTIMLRLNNGEIVSRSDGLPFSLIEQELLQLAQNGERIMCIGNKYLFCGNYCIFLIKNMPVDDDGLTSRLRDHLAIMIESCDACIELISYQQKYRQMKDKASSQTQSEVAVGFDNILALFDSSNSKAIKTFEQLARNLEESFIYLGLTDEQEQKLSGYVEGARKDIDKFMDSGVVLHDAMIKISDSVNNLSRNI